MLIATFCLENTLVMLTRCEASDADSLLELSFKDLPSGNAYVHVYAGEDEAVQAFAAVLVAEYLDHDDKMFKFLEDLYKTLAKDFLP